MKVAILDTGADFTHPDISAARDEDRIKYYDFIEDIMDMKDKSGHGTHCTSILAKFAPNAELYIGRVFEGNQADERSAKTVTKVRSGVYR